MYLTYRQELGASLNFPASLGVFVKVYSHCALQRIITRVGPAQTGEADVWRLFENHQQMKAWRSLAETQSQSILTDYIN